ncbi:MAG TPA: DUF4143 domain-containing protein [Candidatus Polarisedimenticolia bacterium]|nr:DUF4143 domain-containing protein [Candidatus Polarisedimenticolia bacterium]
MLRFWTMLAQAHGNIWNASDPGRSLGVSQPAVRRSLDLLTGLSMVRQLQPWHANLTKRQVKSPKVYVRDSGVLHALLGLRTDGALLSHPKIGASWEGYIIEEVLKAASPHAVYFWVTHQGAELDLLLVKGRRRAGVEFKYLDAPELTRSMRIAMEDLQLNRLTVIHPGESEYTLARRVQVLPASKIGSKDHEWLAAR